MYCSLAKRTTSQIQRARWKRKKIMSKSFLFYFEEVSYVSVLILANQRDQEIGKPDERSVKEDVNPDKPVPNAVCILDL